MRARAMVEGTGALTGGHGGARAAGRSWSAAILAPLADPRAAFAIALLVYLARAALSSGGWEPTRFAYFNWLADAFLHGQLHLRLIPPDTRDLIAEGGRLYLYWPPFPAVLLLPLIAVAGVGVSDVVYTAVIGAATVGLLAWLLALLDREGIAPLDAPRRALLTLGMAFGSTLLILAPVGTVWFTAQLVGWGCVLGAAIAGLAVRGPWGYLLAGLALACAAGTRNALGFNALWLGWLLLRRDWHEPPRRRLWSVAAGVAPLVAGIALLGWYNWARFGSPLEAGLLWHLPAELFEDDFRRYGVFSPHYLPTNLRYQFWAYTVFSDERWLGGGLFWMTPLLLGAFAGLWAGWRRGLTWALLASCLLIYVPIGLLMGTGYLTFGPRYLLDLTVPLVVLTALGIRRWPLPILLVLALIGCATYAYGSALWRDLVYALL